MIFMEADRFALGIGNFTLQDRLIYEFDIWKYERLLRKLEYYLNCKRSWGKYKQYLMWRHKCEGHKLGFSIPPNVFGPGLSIAHPGTLIVNPNVRVGENCRIHNCVHLATQAGSVDACPKIGNNVFIAPGVVMFGDIKIADDIAIGANSVVNRSFLEKGITIAGVPARKISNEGSKSCYHRSTEMLRAMRMAEVLLKKSNLCVEEENPDLQLVVKNNGNEIWTKDTLLRIGTSHEFDRISEYYHPSWISPNRICTFSEDEVPPGEVATFNFRLTTNRSAPAEMFQLVIEGKCWIPNSEFKIIGHRLREESR